MQVQAVINSAVPRETSNGTIYDIDLGGQLYSTFDPDMQRLANEHLGQIVIAEVEVKPSKDGRFTNYFFNGIPGAAPVGPPALGPQPVAAAAQQQPVQQLMGPPAPTQVEKDARISFLSTLQSASRLVGQVYEGAGPEHLVEAQDNATVLAKAWFKLALQAPSQASRPAPLQAVPEPAPQPTQAPASNEIPDW